MGWGRLASCLALAVSPRITYNPVFRVSAPRGTLFYSLLSRGDAGR